jgi:DNA-binding NarL/FixJ family response regulator
MHQVGRVYRVESVQVASFVELESCCRRQAPRLLLVDVALVAPEGVDALRDLRRRLPATDWLLGWEAPSTQGVNAAARSQVRGCIDWAASADQLAQALDAVLAGVLWFSAPVLQALYLSLLEATPFTGPPETGATGQSAKLTSREEEVLSLMRRGMSNKQIAGRLDISVNTVKKHLAHVFAKHGLHGRRQQIA